jgi:predicted nicotinamide N-methyase
VVAPVTVTDVPDDIVRREAARLRARIEATNATTDEVLSIGPLRIPFTRVTDPDAVLDSVADAIDRRERATGVREDDVQHLPYWAELWDSAYGVARRVVDRSASWGLRKHHVLDLGCGLGLAGTVAAAVGADVLLADIEEPALLFARLNTLRYGSRTRRLDWQKDRLDQRFDLILGADILYDKTQWPFLEPFWRHHLAKSGTVVLGEPGRQTGDLFVDWIADKGWSLSRVQVKVQTRDRPIRIFELARQ